MKKMKQLFRCQTRVRYFFLVFLNIAAFGIIPLKAACAATGVITNGGFERPYVPVESQALGSIANGWQDSSTGFDTDPSNAPVYSDSTWVNNQSVVFQGNDSQQLDFSVNDANHVVQFQSNTINFGVGYYQANVWLRSPSTLTVDLRLMNNSPNYDKYGSEQVTLAAGVWQRCSVTASFTQAAAGTLQIHPENSPPEGSLYTLYADDADLENYSTGVHTNVGSGDESTIQNAITHANPGDTLVLAAGTYNFASTVTIDKPIQVVGSTDSNGKNLTILQNTYTSSSPQALFYITADNVRLNQLNFQGIVGNGICYDEGIMGSNIQRFCIKNCNFSNFGVAGVSIYGDSKGVISKCYFTDIYRNTMTDLGYGVLVKGDGLPANWPATPLYGMANEDNAVYVEDCNFIRDKHAISSGNSSKYVFRFNNCLDCGGTNTTVLQSVDAHGNEAGNTTGSRSYEIYGNTIDYRLLASQGKNAFAGICIRGGDGMIYGNTVYNAGWPIVVENLSPVIPPLAGSKYPVLNEPPYSLTNNLYAWGNSGMQYGDPAYPEGYNTEPLQLQLLPAPGDNLYLQAGVNFHNVSGPPTGYTMYTDPHPLAAN